MEKDHNMILDELRKERRFKEIVEYIKQLPAEEITYEIAGRLASAYNNLYQYRNALRVLDKWAVEGEDDPNWHFRRGYAYFFSGYYDLAEEELHHSLALDENDCEAMYLLIILYQMNNEKHEVYTRLLSRLKELNPELYRAEFGKKRTKLPTNSGKSHTIKSYSERWSKMADAVVEQWSEAGKSWNALTESQQQILGIALFDKAVRKKGFLAYFCYSPEGCISFSYLSTALRQCEEDDSLSQQATECTGLVRKAIIGMYQVIQGAIQANVPFYEIPAQVDDVELQTIDIYELAYKELYNDLTEALYTHYHNDEIFEAGKSFPSNYRLCYAMLYKFCDEVQQYTIGRFQELIRRIEDGPLTYRKLQQYLDKLTLQLNNMAMLYELSEQRRYTFNACITETLSYILDWYDIDIDVERALQRRTW